jgi:hypothetical protein
VSCLVRIDADHDVHDVPPETLSGIAGGTPTCGSSCSFLSRATPRQDPDRVALRSSARPFASRQALREQPDRDPRRYETNRDVTAKSEVVTSRTRSRCPGRGLSARRFRIRLAELVRELVSKPARLDDTEMLDGPRTEVDGGIEPTAIGRAPAALGTPTFSCTRSTASPSCSR